jgi:hypothetical protein
MTRREMADRLVELSAAHPKTLDEEKRARIRAEYQQLHAQWMSRKRS